MRGSAQVVFASVITVVGVGRLLWLLLLLLLLLLLWGMGIHLLIQVRKHGGVYLMRMSIRRRGYLIHSTVVHGMLRLSHYGRSIAVQLALGIV